MKNLKNLIAIASLVALLSVGVFAQQQGAQTLNTTTLAAAVTSASGTSIKLTSTSNVINTVSAQTTIWVDTEAMDIVTNAPVSNGYVTVTRGSHGTKAELHASGRTVYVGRPNLFQGYDQAGACTVGSGYATKLPWINLTDGKRFNCYSGGEWFFEGVGSQGAAATAVATGFCTGTLGSAQTDFLNGAACSGATTALYRYTVTTPGEVANLRVFSSASESAAAGDALTVLKNGSSTALTCTILQNATTCSDLTHSFAVVAGDVLTFQVVAATSAAGANISASAGIYGQ